MDMAAILQHLMEEVFRGYIRSHLLYLVPVSYTHLDVYKRQEMYHLYIFDIEMPEMNGLQLAKEIRK